MTAATADRRRVLGGALAAGLAAPLAAWAEPFVLPSSEVVRFRSAVNGVAYALYVRTPADYDPKAERLPLILLLDADYSFALASMVVEHLADRRQGPRAIVAAIAYDGVYPDREGYRFNRSRDYTPVFSPTGGYGETYQVKSGGGPAFLKAIETEVLPRLEAGWSLVPGDRTLVGHSYGGLFGSWVLQERPDLFRRYLLVSPSLWYKDEMILKREAARPAAPLPAPTRVFLSVGSREAEAVPGQPMVAEMKSFAAMLEARKDPRLEVGSRVFDGETHASIFPAAFSTGIRLLFSPWPEFEKA